MTRVMVDSDPNKGPVDMEEAEIADLARLGFTVTRLDEPKKAAAEQSQTGKGSK